MFKIRKQANLHIKKNNHLFLTDKLLYRLSFVSKLRRYTLSPGYNNYCAKQYKNRSYLLQTVFSQSIANTLDIFSSPTSFLFRILPNKLSFLCLDLIFKKFCTYNFNLFSKVSLNFNYFCNMLLDLFYSCANNVLATNVFNFLAVKLLKAQQNTRVPSMYLNNAYKNSFYFFQNFHITKKQRGTRSVFNWILSSKNPNFQTDEWSSILDAFFRTYKSYTIKFNLQPKYFPILTVTVASSKSSQNYYSVNASTVLASLT